MKNVKELKPDSFLFSVSTVLPENTHTGSWAAEVNRFNTLDNLLVCHNTNKSTLSPANSVLSVYLAYIYLACGP